MSSTAKSAPTAHSTPAAMSPANSAAQAKSSEPAVQSNVEEKSAAATSPARMAFPLALTVVAVLPIAFGLGSVRLKASASRAGVASVASSESTSDHSATDFQPADRRIGDREFLERRYEVALKYYRTLGSPNPDRLPPELLYRITLCQEALGFWDEALVGYRAVAESARGSFLRAAACNGQVRIWFKMNTPDQAELLLRSLEFHSGDGNRLPKVISEDNAFLIPLAMAQKCVEKGDKDSTFPVSQLLDWSLEMALSWADGPMTGNASELESAPSSAPVNADSLQCQLHRKSNNVSSTFLINEWTVDILCRNQPIQSVVERLAQDCGWVLDWSDLKDDQSLRQPINIDVENRPVWSVLTSLCSELRASWSIDGDQLKISRTDPDGVRTRRMIARTLGSLTAWLPKHRLVKPARFALGQLVQSQGEIYESAEIFSSLVGRDSSIVAIRAAFNAANNYYRLGDFPKACVQLRFVVDGAPEQNLHTEALILLGRLLLDQGESQEAMFLLRRATESRLLPDQQARAAIFLGMAYLMQDNYQAAAEAVFARKSQLEEPGLRYAAAFVTAYARWHAVDGELKEREATFMYRSLAALKNNSEWLGQNGQLLIGRAYRELGFDDQMADLYSHLLTGGVTVFIEAEMTYSLAGYELANGRREVANQLWLKLSDGPASRWKERARMKLAELALSDGRSRDALELCELIQPGEGVTRSEILRLMGRAYEQLGDDVLAASCYAGSMPIP